ncbi:uncharacterized protein Z520_01704 [Fonsecaea multimorphosa CBS 102226]|uniref:Uncharacterized protein n=1 Tax=Fonsecaea multimorphosa CBS 102226 TaxID=1442371 RepID=A0A0D2J1G4_9EURO|nr:uncharacterized protein Z520_01704 [Fonsecaea multimorphosa CBS 102226]KIY03237.1 hypothetical protein Z520_01704 [Fonsecaea multimorphosa CBS 102226]OAL30476.1 hypothetical protein AYO22_01674 [Fonsecaea multimorphosa]
MSSSGRHFPNDKPPSRRADAHQELLASLTRINAYNPPVQTCSTGWTFHGLYYGPTSVAYLFFRLSQLYPDLTFKGQSLLDWAQAYLDLGQSSGRESVDANHCGIGNEVLAQLAIRAAMEQDASLAQQLCSYETVINGADGSNEWLYGRSGYLYYLRLARSGFQEGSKASELIEATIRKTVQRILTSKQPWTWHGKAYLGAAHGTFGILCQLLLSSPWCAQTVEQLLSSLLDAQLPSGNFPASLPPGSDKLVQFCHGGPGAVLALRSLRPHFPNLQGKIDSAIKAAQKDTWERGLLTKQPSLCHGIAGNALALDDDAEFQHFLTCMSTEALESVGWLKEAGRDDQFVALYTGEAGRAWAWAVADKGFAEKTCIGFNDL